MTHTGYDPSLVALSIVIAVLASYTALDLGGRVAGAAPLPRAAWVATASLAMGGGIWSMHFVGMLAFQMAMPVLYGFGLTALSLLIAVGATGAAFAWVSRRGAARRDILVSGPLMGVGVAAMHYTGMAAMEIPGDLAYSPPVVAASVVIAVTAATAALWLATRQNGVWQKAVAAAVMGLAVSGMHYTGMAAATFTEERHGGAMAHASGVGLAQGNLALSVAGATFLILFLGMFASALDQQRVGRDLHASEERFRAAAEAVGDIIWTADAAGRMRDAQPYWERFTGQTRAEYQDMGWTAAIHPDDLGATLEAWNAAVEAERTYVAEQRLRRHDGEYRVCSIRAVPVPNRAGRVREWVGVHEDITERRRAEDELRDARVAAEEANEAKSAFIANMSHELRTPLSAIIGYSEMMAEEIGEGVEAGELAADMAKVEGNARHLLGLINDVLDLSKVESGKMEVFAEDFDVEPMLREVAATVETLVARKGNALALRFEPGLGAMRSDATKVRQILLNLLSNAAKFTEGGTITLSAVRLAGGAGGDWLSFRVADTGIGMDEGQLGRLFQRFSQADSSTTRRFGGTGLGLALSKAFGVMLGGDLSVESRTGVGSAFTAFLPARVEDGAAGAGPPAAPGAAPPAGAAGGPGGAREVVLVIEDDPGQRDLMTRFLAREGFGAVAAVDGHAGLQLAKSLRPRAILLDVTMPGLDGWSVLSALKADPAVADIPVIMVTLLDERGLATALGAADYVMKPVNWDRFRQVMDRYREVGGGNAVLVVEDDADTRRRIGTVLERDGWGVTEASHGRDALDRVAEAVPSVILLDLEMPVMDGFEFLRSFRALPGCGAVPVVVLTAKDLTRDDRRRLQGASAVLGKGVTSLASLSRELARVMPPGKEAA